MAPGPARGPRGRPRHPAVVGWAGLVGIVSCSVAVDGLSAQVEPYEPSDGFFDTPLSRGPDVFTACATDLPVRHDGPIVELECSVVDSTSVAGARAGPAWLIQYRRGALLSYDDFVDTLSIDELVLVRATGPTDFEALWHVPRIRKYEFIDQIGSAEKDGGVLVSYLICLNGTGGCAEHFLFGASDWSVLAQPFLDDLAAAVPEGWSLHKGRALDLSTMEGVQPISRPGDANCCPSGMMRFRLEIVGNELRLVDAEVTGRTSLHVGPTESVDDVADRLVTDRPRRRTRSADWTPHFGFRDALVHDPKLRSRFESSKRFLAERFPDDRKAYRRAKAAFIAAELEV